MNRHLPHEGVTRFDGPGAADWPMPSYASNGSNQGRDLSALAVEHQAFSTDNDWQPDSAEAVYQGGGRQVPIGGTPKRVLDILVALTALLLSLPVMLVAAALIKITMGGPVLFKHKRIGFQGKPFYCYKFRTMVSNGDQVLAEYLSRHPEARREWEENRKLRNDPRVTFLGAMLRKSSIDELPQLFNVLKGEMSCVGPRPVVAEELERYGSAAAIYLRMRPGMTGLWQTSGRSCVDYARRVAYDVDYGRNWSLMRDLFILARTVVVVANFREAA